MSVSEMTYVSYFFIFMAFIFGVTAVVLFVALDIRRCWRIVQGRQFVFSREAIPLTLVSNAEQRNGAKTERLISKKTETLLTFEETASLETITLVQDIVIMGVDGCR